MTRNILICGVNWLGDSVMSMPALQEFRRRRGDCSLTLLVQNKLVSLGSMLGTVDRVIGYAADPWGTLGAVRSARAGRFDVAYVFANSFRSALIPMLAGIRERVGAQGHRPAWMLTRVVDPGVKPGHEHQMWEYLRILGLESDVVEPEAPRLTLPAGLLDEARHRLAAPVAGPIVGLIPGAARGKAKQWPEEHFAATGRRLAAGGARIAIFGTRAEAELCGRVGAGIGAAALNLAGETSLPSLAAHLALCRVVIANDSGGMHLASAVGARVVGIFGMTDPVRTGPIGSHHRVISREDVSRARDIARESHEANAILRSITPDAVHAAALELLREG